MSTPGEKHKIVYILKFTSLLYLLKAEGHRQNTHSNDAVNQVEYHRSSAHDGKARSEEK